MKVSVIIPNYNHGRYLEQRINSVLNQTFRDFEIIILDDLSTDNSRVVIEKFRSNPMISKVIYNEKNSGSTFLQWDKGISLARGSYIWIAESDDWCEPTLLETLVQGIQADERCVLSFCQTSCVDGKGQILYQTSHSRLSEVIDGKSYVQTNLWKNNSIVNASMVLWKRGCFDLIPKDFFSYKFCGDWLFWTQLCSLGKVHISGKVLSYFRKHDGDVTSRVNKSGMNFIEELKVISWIFRKGFISRKKFFKAVKYRHRIYFQLRSGISPEINTEIKKLISEMELTPLQKMVISLDGYHHMFTKKD